MANELAHIVVQTLYEKANTHAAALYQTLHMIPFKEMRELLEQEISAFEEGRLKEGHGLDAIDVKMAKHKMDMFETIYYELHAYATDLAKAKEDVKN